MPRTLAWTGLVVALIVGAAVRWTPPAEVQDLRPRPDALEYEEAARNLVAGEGYSLVLDGGRYPPRYPPGFSLLLVPSVWLTGGVHGGGIWAVLAAALAGIAAVWGLGLATGGAASAVAASLLLALAPLHVRWSRAVMADVPVATLTTLLALGGVLCLGRGARWPAWGALGVAAGLAALVRSTCTLLAVPLAVAAVAQGGGMRPALRRLVALAGGVAVGLLPVALYGVARFGSPLASGYEYWVPADYFGWAYLTERPAGGGSASNLVFYVTQLAGLGSLYPWPVAVLAAAGLAVGLGRAGPARRLAGLTIGTAVVLLAAYLPFFWQWDRFLLPLLPLVVALAAVPVGRDAPGALRLAGGALVALALAGAWLTPGAFAAPDRPLGEVVALRTIAARVEPNAALIAHGNVVLVERLFHDGTDRLWLPIGRCEHRERIRTLRRTPYAPARVPQNWLWDVIASPPEGPDVEGAVRLLLAAGRPVYWSPMLAHQAPGVPQVGRQLAARFRLEPIATDTPTGLVRIHEKAGAAGA